MTTPTKQLQLGLTGESQIVLPAVLSIQSCFQQEKEKRKSIEIQPILWSSRNLLVRWYPSSVGRLDKTQKLCLSHESLLTSLVNIFGDNPGVHSITCLEVKVKDPASAPKKILLVYAAYECMIPLLPCARRAFVISHATLVRHTRRSTIDKEILQT